MSKTTTAVAKVPSLDVVRAELASKPFRPAVVNVVDETSYAKADIVLSRIGERRKWLKGMFDSILKPLNEVRTAALAFKNAEDGPLENAEIALRQGMSAYKNAERDKEIEAQRLRQIEENKARREAEEKQRAADAAKTPAVKARLEQAAIALEDKADEIAAVPLPQPVRAAHSTTRVVKEWGCDDKMALIKAVAAGEVPEDALEINSRYVNECVRAIPGEVAKWPGMKVWESTQIVRR